MGVRVDESVCEKCTQIVCTHAWVGIGVSVLLHSFDLERISATGRHTSNMVDIEGMGVGQRKAKDVVRSQASVITKERLEP